MKRSKFSLSSYRLLTCKMGALVPIGITEVLPGDTFQHNTSLLIRCSPLVTPVMHPVHARVHHWFVPNRLVWDNWESFITGGPDGMDASVFPTITQAVAEKSLCDYYGLPISPDGIKTTKFSALPLRGYNLIYNEWYRDQDLTTALTFSKADGNDTTTNTTMLNVAWEKDYFTTARPWTQKGPEVTIPLVGNAPVKGLGTTGSAYTANVASVHESDGGTRTYPFGANSGTQSLTYEGTAASGAFPKIFADLTGVSATDINSLRLAFALQRYEEARARYGSRYVEYLRYLGVRSSDARLQRPEYLGGGRQTIQFSEVLQTGGDSTGDPTGVGNLAGHGIGALRSNRYRRFFEEHGYVHSFLSIKPRTIYAQGQKRTWNRTVKEDFWTPELQHIGQQEVYDQEVMGYPTVNGVFGYQDRYDEYRREESQVTGEFRNELDMWHLARIFASKPALNSSFVVSDPTNRIFADQTGTDTMLIMASHSLQARRMVARTGTSFIF